MLLLMRRVGEIIRIGKKITLQIKEINAENVSFLIDGLDGEIEIEPLLEKVSKKEKIIVD